MLRNLKSKQNHLVLLPILLLAAFLTVWKIWDETTGNAYYTAAVSGMIRSWHNFFYACFDGGGYITVDKPAPGLWLQALFAALFGVSGWSVILPEALCAVGSVAVLYHVVQRSFGRAAGLFAALALALTPIFVAVARTNNLDSSLVLVMLLAAWAAVAAAERGNLWLLLAAVGLIGVGFNIKMLQAWMALPAVAGVYLFTAKVTTGKRILHLTAAFTVLLAVSLSWALIVDSTPAENRPYIGGSSTNSVLELAVGYNGIQRVVPAGSPGGMGGPDGNDGRGGMGQGGPMNEGGQAGVLRLFNDSMAGQASWLIPFALAGLLALALGLRRADGECERNLRHLLCWGLWILPMMGYFSIAGFFHRYYLSVLAPGLAALFGIGAVLLWRLYRREGWKRALLPLSIAATAAVQCIILARYELWGDVLVPIVLVCAGALAALLILWPTLARKKSKALPAAAAAGLLALLIAPAAWSVTPLFYGSQVMLPIAGPELAGINPSGDMGGRGFPDGMGGPGSFGGGAPGGQAVSEKLLSFLAEHSRGEKFLLAVPDANTAAPIILATGKAVMAVGGFSGNDNALTVEKLEQMVNDGELRYFMAGGGRGGWGGQQNAILNWVREHGREVPADEWGGASPGRGSFEGGGTLYELS